MGICETAAQAATGLRTGAGANLLNALNLIGAADVAIRIGSGGRAGATDLPGIVASERGIECYSPNSGESIWVTPLQWYANGMSCSGLRDPDREALEKRIRELQERARLRDEIRRQGFNLAPNSELPLNSDELRRLNDQIKNAGIANGFGENGGGLEFLMDGVFVCNWNYAMFSDYNSHASYPNPNGYVTNYAVKKNDKIITESISPHGYYFRKDFYLQRATGGREVIPGGVEIMIQGRTPPKYTGYRGPDLWGWTGEFSPSAYEFKPNGSPPPTSNGSGNGYPINPPEQPEPPEENNCMGGCRCGDIAQATRQNTQTMERLIKEIHNAVNASAFATGNFMFAPEGMIENQGRTIYSQNPGRGGTIRSKNLFEAVSALIASHYHRMGLHRFPAKVPDNLIPKTGLGGVIDAVDGDTKDLQDFAAFQKWQFEQWDAATGHYPIKFKIADDGGTPKDVFLWNQSEALAEIFGMLTKVVEDADIGVQWGVRASTEAVGAKAAALKALFAIEQLIEFSGGLSEKKYQKMDISFTPDPFGDVSKVEEMLKPSKQDIEVIDIVDGRSLLGLLLHISYYSQLGGLAVLGDTKPNPSTGQTTNIPGDGIREQKKKDKQQQSKFEKDWDKWKTKTKGGFVPNSTQQQSRGGLPKSDLEDITTQSRQP